MAVSVEIQGFKEASQVLDTLPDKIQATVLRSIFRKAARPLINDAKSRLLGHDPNLGRLADAIGVISVSTNDPVVVVGVRAKGKYKDIGYIGHWIEYGVSGIKKGYSRNLTREGDDSYRIWVSSVKKGERYRKDIPPKPYMRPAIDSQRSGIASDVRDKLDTYLYTETQKALTRYMKKKSA